MHVPFFEFIDMRVLKAADRQASCDMEYGTWFAGVAEMGIPAGLPAIADCSLAYAASQAGPPGSGAVSISLHLDYLDGLPLPGTRVTGTSRVTSFHGNFAVAEGQIFDATEKPLASMSLRALAVPTEKMGASVSTPRPPSDDVKNAATPVDALRRKPGSPVGVSPDLARLLGTELGNLLGASVTRLADDGIELVVLPPADLLRSQGVVHGGAVGVIGHFVLACALHSAVPQHARPRRLDLHIDYLRPALADTPMTVRARVAHHGRSVAITSAEMLAPDGRVVAMARETVLLQTS